MKRIYLYIPVVFIIFIEINVLHAQPKETKLNQVELIKKITGNWRCEIATDTICYFESKTFGTGLENYFKYVTRGKIIMEGKELMGYDQRVDKFIMLTLFKGVDTEFGTISFISDTKFEILPYGYTSNPEKASYRTEGEIKSANMYVETMVVNGKPVHAYIYKRIIK